jgi:hypothetical protein
MGSAGEVYQPGNRDRIREGDRGVPLSVASYSRLSIDKYGRASIVLGGYGRINVSPHRVLIGRWRLTSETNSYRRLTRVNIYSIPTITQ